MGPISNIFPSVNLPNAQDSGLAVIAASYRSALRDLAKVGTFFRRR